jgi:uncharacterized membrane protein YbhN (UPF0104 family)
MADDPARPRYLTVRLAATVAAAAGLAWLVDPRTVLARLSHLQPAWTLGFLLLSLPFYLLQAWRWHFTAARLGAPFGFRRAWLDYYLSALLNQVMPIGVAGDVARAARHSSGGAWTGARAVVLERLSGFVALLLFVLASGILWITRANVALQPGRVGLALALGAAVLFAARRFSLRPGGAVAALVGEARAAMVLRGAFAFQLAISGAVVALLLAMFACAAGAAGSPLPPVAVIQIVPLILAATTLPWAFAGWGVRELSTAALYRAMGLDPAAGVAVSVTFGVLSLAAALPGVMVLVTWARRRSP